MNHERRLGMLINNIETAQNDRKMFIAVKNLNRKKYQNPFVYDAEGKTVTKSSEIYQIVNIHF